MAELIVPLGPRPRGEGQGEGTSLPSRPSLEAPPAPAAVLTATNLSVGRAREIILAGVSLTITPGARVALVGRNGAGKTTLLRVLAGLDPPRAGHLCWAGRPLPAGPARARMVGVLLQSEPVGPFTVRELVTLGLGLDHPPDAQARAKVAAAMARAGLDHLADRPVATLSGGEAQRAALARALAPGPRLLLLDEPCNHLDPSGRATLLAILDALDGETAVVFASHDLDLAGTADVVVLLAGGGVLAAGPPERVLQPARLGEVFGVVVRQVTDPGGGAPFLRVEGDRRFARATIEVAP